MHFEITIDDVKHFLVCEGISNNLKAKNAREFSVNSPFTDDTKSRLSFSYVKGHKEIPEGVYFNDFKARGTLDDDVYKGSFYKFVKLLKDFKTLDEAKYYYLSNYLTGNLSDVLQKPKVQQEEQEKKKLWRISLPENTARFDRKLHPTYHKYLQERGIDEAIINKHRIFVNTQSKRIIFPIYDGDDLVFYIGRSIIKHIPKEFRWKKVSASEMIPIWNLDQVDSPICVVNESIMDAIHLHNGIATLTPFVSEGMRDKILNKGFNKIIVAMQNPYKDKTANVQRFKVAERFAEKHDNVYLYDWRGIPEKDFGEIRAAKKEIDIDRTIKYDFAADVAHKMGIL